MDYKARQDYYHRTKNIEDDIHKIKKTVIYLKSVTEEVLVESIMEYLTKSQDELIYPSKSYAVALIYAKLLEFYFNVPFYNALDDPDLLYNNDDFFVPYNSAKQIYDQVILKTNPLVNPQLPQISATIEYFKKEFLIN